MNSINSGEILCYHRKNDKTRRSLRTRCWAHWTIKTWGNVLHRQNPRQQRRHACLCSGTIFPRSLFALCFRVKGRSGSPARFRRRKWSGSHYSQEATAAIHMGGVCFHSRFLPVVGDPRHPRGGLNLLCELLVPSTAVSVTSGPPVAPSAV